MRKCNQSGTPGQRHRRKWVREGEKGMTQVPRELRKGKKKSGGRDNGGRISVRHRGGGEKRVLRKRVNGGKEGGVGRVRGLQYDPNRSGRVARRKVRREGSGECSKAERRTEYRYILGVEGREVGNRVNYGGGGRAGSGEGRRPQRRGSTHTRKERVVGIQVCNVSVTEGGEGKYRRAAGVRGELRQKRPGKVQIRRKGGKRREVSDRCTATVGIVRGEEHRKESRGKAGTSRRRGRRPTVRGEAMNPVDHPHGGRTRGGRQEVTPWTRRAKGVRTRRKNGPTGKQVFRSTR